VHGRGPLAAVGPAPTAAAVRAARPIQPAQPREPRVKVHHILLLLWIIVFTFWLVKQFKDYNERKGRK
jgi:beta-lactamase regulating signal transducer with metallopeptidase domain